MDFQMDYLKNYPEKNGKKYYPLVVCFGRFTAIRHLVFISFRLETLYFNVSCSYLIELMFRSRARCIGLFPLLTFWHYMIQMWLFSRKPVDCFARCIYSLFQGREKRLSWYFFYGRKDQLVFVQHQPCLQQINGCYKRILGFVAKKRWIMGQNSKYYGIRFHRRSQNFGFHMIARLQLIADDRKQSSQKVEHGSIFCDRLRSSATTIGGSQTREVCFHMIADDRRTFCDLRSAIVCDHMETSLKASTSGARENCTLIIQHFIALASSQWCKWINTKK